MFPSPSVVCCCTLQNRPSFVLSSRCGKKNFSTRRVVACLHRFTEQQTTNTATVTPGRPRLLLFPSPFSPLIAKHGWLLCLPFDLLERISFEAPRGAQSDASTPYRARLAHIHCLRSDAIAIPSFPTLITFSDTPKLGEPTPSPSAHGEHLSF